MLGLLWSSLPLATTVHAQVIGHPPSRLLSVVKPPLASLLPCLLTSHRFEEAIKAGRISAVDALRDCCVLAAVGQKMASRRGMAATMFAALAKANINIRAIAQGSSEFNITTLIDQKDSGGCWGWVGGWVGGCGRRLER